MASASFAAPSADVAALPVDPARRAILMTLVIAATVMQVLDQTIANVALPHMQGALGAAPDTISWVLTSYIVASAVATPVTGWLSDKMGRRNLLIMTVAGLHCRLRPVRGLGLAADDGPPRGCCRARSAPSSSPPARR